MDSIYKKLERLGLNVGSAKIQVSSSMEKAETFSSLEDVLKIVAGALEVDGDVYSQAVKTQRPSGKPSLGIPIHGSGNSSSTSPSEPKKGTPKR